jgi:YD repeat-containing protein
MSYLHEEPPNLSARAGRARILISAATVGLLAIGLAGVVLTATVTYIYDAAGRLQTVQYDDCAQTAYTLHAAGNRTFVSSTTAPTVPRRALRLSRPRRPR